MMLPEHVEMIKKVWVEDQQTTKPVLDEQQLEEMNTIIEEAIAFDNKLYFNYYKKGEIHSLIGYIHNVNILKKKLYIVDQFHHTVTLDMSDILHISTTT